MDTCPTPAPANAHDTRHPRLPTVEVVARDALHITPEGPTAGHAHVGFPSHPSDAPGHLDFGPLWLCAVTTLPPGMEAPLHPHAGVEIVEVLRRGRMRYRDSLGHDLDVVGPTVGTTSAGRGLEHGVRVGPKDPLDGVILFFGPDAHDDEPIVGFRPFVPDDRSWRVLASGRPGSPAGALPLRSDVSVVRAAPSAGASLVYDLAPGRRAYVLGQGDHWSIAGRRAHDGDRALIRTGGPIALGTHGTVEFLLIDLPA